MPHDTYALAESINLYGKVSGNTPYHTQIHGMKRWQIVFVEKIIECKDFQYCNLSLLLSMDISIYRREIYIYIYFEGVI